MLIKGFSIFISCGHFDEGIRAIFSNSGRGSPKEYYCEIMLKWNNRPFPHCFCACVYRPLFLDNRRDFTQMGKTDFKSLILSM